MRLRRRSQNSRSQRSILCQQLLNSHSTNHSTRMRQTPTARSSRSEHGRHRRIPASCVSSAATARRSILSEFESRRGSSRLAHTPPADFSPPQPAVAVAGTVEPAAAMVGPVQDAAGGIGTGTETAGWATSASIAWHKSLRCSSVRSIADSIGKAAASEMIAELGRASSD